MGRDSRCPEWKESTLTSKCVSWNAVSWHVGGNDLAEDDLKMGQISGSHSEKQEVLSQACRHVWRAWECQELYCLLFCFQSSV